MGAITWEHIEGGCPAYPYCAAIEAYGLSTKNGKECLFSSLNGSVQLNETAREKINAADDKVLIEALAEEAKNRLVFYENIDVNLDEVETLVQSLENIFQARMTLWQSMIDAACCNRPFTDVELAYHTKSIINEQAAYKEVASRMPPATCLCAQCAHDRDLKDRYELQFDAAIINDINRLVGNILNTRPTLIVGDKGIAKTQVAKFVMSLFNSDPIVISVKGDMMSDELIGKIKHDKEENTFVFQEGILLSAMKSGLPVLLDEINFGDQAIIARLQDILLKKPGESVFIQESGDETIEVAPGFTVFATANEASVRYRHREILDPAIRDRFDIIIRNYPDLTNDPLIDTSNSLLRIALSSAVDTWGIPSPHINLPVLEMFVRLAHATQYLYAVPGKDISIQFSEDRVTSSVLEESQPLMTDCITPRTVSKIVADCAAGNLPGIALNYDLIQNLMRSLDQAGSTHNFELAEQVGALLDLGNEEERLLISGDDQDTTKGPFTGLSSGAFSSLLTDTVQPF